MIILFWYIILFKYHALFFFYIINLINNAIRIFFWTIKIDSTLPFPIKNKEIYPPTKTKVKWILNHNW